jgi:hypothetical protein
MENVKESVYRRTSDRGNKWSVISGGRAKINRNHRVEKKRIMMWKNPGYRTGTSLNGATIHIDY